MTNTANKTQDMILCALFAALIAVGAWLRIPTPLVPITLQTLFVLLAGLLLGGRRAAISVLVYIFIGLLGVPVFAEGGGLGYLLKPSFGYIIGFAAGAYWTGRIAHGTESPSYLRLLLATLAGLAVIYLCGLIYLYLISNLFLDASLGLWALLLYGFLLTLPGDLALCAAAAWLAKRLLPVIPRRTVAKKQHPSG